MTLQTMRPANGRAHGSTPGGHGGDTATPALGWHVPAIEHAADIIVVADLDGTVRYVNPAFERETGCRRDAVTGRHVRALAGPGQAAALEAAMAAIARGETWSGEIARRRPDGLVTRFQTSVAPVRGALGEIVGGVAISRNVTHERALESRLDETRRERAALAAALTSLRSRETAEETAEALCAALTEVSTFGGVGVFAFEPDGAVVPLAALDQGRRVVALPGPLTAERSAYVRERASRGPWIEDWHPAPGDPYAAVGERMAVGVLAYAPVRSHGETLGLLVANAPADGQLDVAESLPALVEAAAFAGALLGPALRARNSRAVGAARIGAVIADRAFLPVFQPIVELTTRAVVGYEGLTRFADGSAPYDVFAEAGRSGLALQLEAATLEAILGASAPLTAAAWLNLNVSADFVLAGDPLASLVRRCQGPVVLELTEHAQVADYQALRAAIERLGPNVRLAVDDAGAGFASLRHILELRPDYVKLDRALIRDVDRDPARQGLVAGLVHFADKAGATLIAEGVETEAEAHQLRELGVALAQGYRLGRPALASRVAAAAGAAVGRPSAARSSRRREAAAAPTVDIGQAVNIGAILAATLRGIGIATVRDLQAIGAVPAWERVRAADPAMATGTTLLQLEGATRGVRLTQIAPAERSRLRLLARLATQAL